MYSDLIRHIVLPKKTKEAISLPRQNDFNFFLFEQEIELPGKALYRNTFSPEKGLLGSLMLLQLFIRLKT